MRYTTYGTWARAMPMTINIELETVDGREIIKDLPHIQNCLALILVRESTEPVHVDAPYTNGNRSLSLHTMCTKPGTSPCLAERHGVITRLLFTYPIIQCDIIDKMT